MHFCYIIFSESLCKFYIGETQNVSERLEQHNNGYFKNSFTSKAKDWEIFLILKCSDIVQARKIEKHIKSMKSSVYIKSLKKYPELQHTLLQRYEFQ